METNDELLTRLSMDEWIQWKEQEMKEHPGLEFNALMDMNGRLLRMWTNAYRMEDDEFMKNLYQAQMTAIQLDNDVLKARRKAKYHY
jgi:type II secretory pathway component PulJ